MYRAQLERDSAEYLRRSPSPYLRVFAGFLISRQEIPAIGAQWELASRIPEGARIRLIQTLQKESEALRNGDTQYARGHESSEKQIRLQTAIDIRTIAIESLKRGGLDKSQFILEMLPIHNYDARSFSQP